MDFCWRRAFFLELGLRGFGLLVLRLDTCIPSIICLILLDEDEEASGLSVALHCVELGLEIGALEALMNVTVDKNECGISRLSRVEKS